jgi:hypothetical protein
VASKRARPGKDASDAAPAHERPPQRASERTSVSFVLGVDLGQSHDPTAIAAVRRIDDGNAPIFECGHLERLPLGTSYPGVVRHVQRLLARPIFGGKAELVIDFTGVGRPVFDMFEAAGISAIGVGITSGDAGTQEGRIYHVPKINLVSRIQALLHDERLKILKSLPDAKVLASELQDFRAQVTDTGYWRFGAREGKHDDLVLALAIALWRASAGGAGLAAILGAGGRSIARRSSAPGTRETSRTLQHIGRAVVRINRAGFGGMPLPQQGGACRSCPAVGMKR